MGGRAYRRTRAPSGRADGQADERMSGRADEQADGRTSGRGRARSAVEWTGADNGRTAGRRISEGKTPNLMRHLIWPWEIQRGRPRVSVKLPDLPPPSQ